MGQPHTMKTAKTKVQQLVDDNLIPSVGQEVYHHTPMSVCSCKAVGGVVLKAAQDSRLLDCSCCLDSHCCILKLLEAATRHSEAILTYVWL